MESKIFHFAFCEFVQQTVNYLPIASSSLKSYASCIKKKKSLVDGNLSFQEKQKG